MNDFSRSQDFSTFDNSVSGLSHRFSFNEFERTGGGNDKISRRRVKRQTVRFARKKGRPTEGKMNSKGRLYVPFVTRRFIRTAWNHRDWIRRTGDEWRGGRSRNDEESESWEAVRALVPERRANIWSSWNSYTLGRVMSSGGAPE